MGTWFNAQIESGNIDIEFGNLKDRIKDSAIKDVLVKAMDDLKNTETTRSLVEMNKWSLTQSCLYNMEMNGDDRAIAVRLEYLFNEKLATD